MQPDAAASIYMRRSDDISLFVGKTEETAVRIALKSAINMVIPSLPQISVTE
jgi:hypothetical protein